MILAKAYHAYMDGMLKTKAGRHILLLKVIVGVGLVVNHFFPGHIGLISNLLWLLAF